MIIQILALPCAGSGPQEMAKDAISKLGAIGVIAIVSLAIGLVAVYIARRWEYGFDRTIEVRLFSCIGYGLLGLWVRWSDNHDRHKKAKT